MLKLMKISPPSKPSRPTSPLKKSAPNSAQVSPAIAEKEYEVSKTLEYVVHNILTFNSFDVDDQLFNKTLYEKDLRLRSVQLRTPSMSLFDDPVQEEILDLKSEVCFFVSNLIFLSLLIFARMFMPMKRTNPKKFPI